MTVETQQINNIHPTPDELAARYQNGDEHAFSELYELLSDKVHKQLLRLGLPTEDALDGVQQVFEKVFTAIHRFETGNLGGWVSTITHNYAMDFHRRAQRSRQRLVDTPLDEVREPAIDDAGFVDLDTGWLVDDILEQVRLHDGKSFEEMELEAILRDVAAGKSRDEISERLGIKKITIGTRLTRLRTRLADSAFTRESLE